MKQNTLYLWLCVSVVMLLGACSSTPETVEEDSVETAKEAREIFKDKAEKGDTEAEYQFGKSFCCGDDPFYDHKQALSWLCKAAKKGHSGAQNVVGNIYYSGENNIGRDATMAYVWYSIAAQDQHPHAVKAQYDVAAGLGFEALKVAKEMIKYYPSIPCEVR